MSMDKLLVVDNNLSYSRDEIEELMECAKKIPILNDLKNQDQNKSTTSISKLITIFKSQQRSRSSSIDYNIGLSSSDNNSNNSCSMDAFKYIEVENHNNNNNNNFLEFTSSDEESSCTSNSSDVGNSCIDSLEIFRLSDDFEQENEMIYNQVGPDRYNDMLNIFSTPHRNLSIMLKEINRDTLDLESECIDESMTDSEWEKCLCCSEIHSLSDYKHVECIGNGGYGVVCKFINRKTNELCAIKNINRNNSALKEINTLKELGGQFAVNIHHTFLSPCKERVFIEMEYLNGGDCAFHLNECAGLGFPEDLVKQYAAETVLCLDFIHNNSIIHCDIKPNNMVIDSEGHIKLLDFGNAKKFNQKKPTSNNGILGSPRYIPPEVLLFEPQSPAVDFWSLGVVLFEMITGSTPFIGETPNEIFESILSRNTEIVELNKDAKDLITKLLDPNPSTRICSNDIKNHPYFNEINWNTIKSTPPPWKPNSTNNFTTSINGSCKLVNSI